MASKKDSELLLAHLDKIQDHLSLLEEEAVVFSGGEDDTEIFGTPFQGFKGLLELANELQQLGQNPDTQERDYYTLRLLREFAFQVKLEHLRLSLHMGMGNRTAQIMVFIKALLNRIRIVVEKRTGMVSATDGTLSDDAGQSKQPKRRVLIVDDSKGYQKILKKICESEKDLDVVGVAADGEEARQKVTELYPDLILLDIHIPKTDPFSFIRQLLLSYPVPVVLISDGDKEVGIEIFDALYQGAVDFIPKSKVQPDPNSIRNLKKIFQETAKIKFEALSRFYVSITPTDEPLSVSEKRIILIGAGKGSLRNLVDLLHSLPKLTPPVIIYHRILPEFSEFLVQKLQEIFPFEIESAVTGSELADGKVFVVPEGLIVTVEPKGKGFVLDVSEGDSSQRHGAIDLLFESTAICAGDRAVAIILSGTGNDGAYGLFELKQNGAMTIVQDESDSIFPEMPRECVRGGGASVSSWGDQIPVTLIDNLLVGDLSQIRPEKEELVLEGQGPRILIVDKSPTVRAAIRHSLRGKGYANFEEAKKGEEAWSLLQAGLVEKSPYQLVICDRDLENMSGHDLLKKVRGTDEFSDLAFILITHAANAQSVKEALAAKVTDYVTKPIAPSVLAKKVVRALEF